MTLQNNDLSINQLENIIGYEFVNKNLLKQALVHSSYANENDSFKNKHNERLEFLGDAVLELIVSELLFENYQHLNEGVLTKMRAKTVCERSFSNISRHFQLTDFILLGKGELATGGKNKESIQADVFEALIGALYLDGGLKAVKKLTKDIFLDILNEIYDLDLKLIRDYKSFLQEHLHKQKISEFKYILYKEEGLAHEKTFYMDVYVNSKSIGRGKGRNKKQAEQMAAKDALERMGVIKTQD